VIPVALSRARGATAAVFFVNGLGIGAWAAAIPTIKTTLTLSSGGLSLALLAFAAGAVIAMPVSGVLVPRFAATGRGTTLAGLCFAVSLLGPMAAAGLPALIAAAFCLGAANGVLDVAMNAHASSIERNWGAAIMSSFHAAYSVGGLAGTGLGATLLQFHTSHRWMLTPAALLAAGVVVPVRSALGTGDAASVSQALLRAPERGLAGLALVALFCMLVEGAMVDWSGLYLTMEGASAAFAAAGFAAFSLAMVAGRLAGDHVVRVAGRSRIIVGGALLAAAGLLLAVVVPRIPAIVVGFALVGVGLSNVVPAVFSASAQMGSSAAAGIAATATAGYAGLVLGPALIGAVATASNLRAGISVMAGAAVVAAATAFFSGRLVSRARN
jgi:MFS family permease